MSSKFVKKLQKDIKKSPGKAAVLALLLGVAVWFWSPLVLGMFGGSQAPTPPAASATTAPANTAVTASAPTSKQPQYTWKQVAAAIDRDPKMKTIEQVALARDAFRVVKPEKAKDENNAKPAPSPSVVLDVPPGDAGLVLTSTIVGPARRVARVNGKSYREGDLIRALADGKPLDYRVVSVGARNVVLALGSREYELKMLQERGGSAEATTVGVSSDSPDFDPTVLE